MSSVHGCLSYVLFYILPYDFSSCYLFTIDYGGSLEFQRFTCEKHSMLNQRIVTAFDNMDASAMAFPRGSPSPHYRSRELYEGLKGLIDDQYMGAVLGF